MAKEGGECPNNISAMDTLISQAGLSSIGSLIGRTPVRTGQKESSEYESKQTNEILDPELNLGRLGYCGTDSICWDKVALPEKKNLYLELYSRITNYTNADCKVYIDSEEFNCHLIVLQCYSELFDAYVAVKKVEIPKDKCSATSFAFIYEWMISGEPSYRDLTRDNVLDIFNSAKYLKIKDLVEQCWAFIDNLEVFNEDTAFLLYMDAKRKNLPEVRELMLPRVQEFFLMLVSSQDWLELDIDDVKNLLKSNYVCVNCEMEIFMSGVRWLKHDWSTRDQFKYEILECIRFGNIAPWQLVDIKRNPENPDFMELAKDPRICKMIDDGLAFVIIKYWYGQENDDFQHWNSILGLQEPPPRNWSGTEKTYFTYREFLIYLDQYRRNQLIEKNKPKMLISSEKRFAPDFGKVVVAGEGGASPDNLDKEGTPRIPTMDEFLAKKRIRRKRHPPKEAFSQIQKHNLRTLAAIIIQRAFRRYILRKKHKKSVKKPVPAPRQRKLEPKRNSSDEARKMKILQLFGLVQKNSDRRNIDSSSRRVKYISELSLFGDDKESIIVMGGVNPQSTYGVGRNTGKNIIRYIASSNVWEYVGNLPEPRHQHCIQFLKGRIYLVGGADPGCEDQVPVGSVWSFDPTDRNWYREHALNNARKMFGLVACNQSLYAIGGQGRNSQTLKSVEAFRANNGGGQWERRADMIKARTGFGYVKYQGWIIVVGGLSDCDNKSIETTIEGYHIAADQWTLISELRQPLCFCSLICMTNRLFLIGGATSRNNNDNNNENNGATIESTNEELSSTKLLDIWHPNNKTFDTLTNLIIGRHGHCLAYLGTQIFIIGGVSTDCNRTLNNVECFCSKRGVFVRGVSCLPTALCGHATVTLPPALFMSNNN